MRKYTFCLFLSLLFLPSIGTETKACSCIGPKPPCQAYGEASAVFIGVVTGDSTIPLIIEGNQYQQRLVNFAIEEAFRGVIGPVTEVITGMGGGDCGFAFKRGVRYLVYTYTNPEDKRLHTGICSRTREATEADEDLQYIRGLSSAAPGALIYGEVQRYRDQVDGGRQQTPLAGLTININSEGRQLQIRTDLQGHFSVGGLPPGTYKLKILLPQGLTSSDAEQEVKVSDRGCAKVHFGVVADGRLSGKVLDVKGQPLPKAEISLCDPAERRYRSCRETAYTDPDGRYEFKAIPPGQYVLGIRFDGLTSQNRPFPLLYYPGVEQLEEARVVDIGEGEQIENYDLSLPAAPAEHAVRGVVLWSDGKPVLNARIEYSQVNVPVAYGAQPDETGSFSFQIYDGMQITLRAVVELSRGKYIYSDYVKATIAGEDANVKIIIPVQR